VASSTRGTADVAGTLDAGDAIIAVLMAAMESSGHTSAEEAERARHIIWSMGRFRQRSGETVERKIDRMRRFIEDRGPSAAIDAAVRQVDKRRRAGVYAVTADLLLVDGRLERLEARFLRDLARRLTLDQSTAKQILDVMRLKNGA